MERASVVDGPHSYLFGGIPEWPKGADCKSVSCAFSGSNPLSPTFKKWLIIPLFLYIIFIVTLFNIAGWSSLEARRAHNPKVVGSNPAPATRTKYCVYAQIAQSVEQRIENPRVTGSIPVLGIFLAKGIRACSSGGRALDF